MTLTNTAPITHIDSTKITYVILNGPPHSGKSIAARYLVSVLNITTTGPACIESFAAPMKHFIAVALGARYRELSKDTPVDVLAGYSVREFLIDLSENYIKPRYGTAAYGRWLVNRCVRFNPLPRFVVVDDGGFVDEADAVPNRLIVRLLRRDTSFINDSRNYLPDPHFVVENNGTFNDLWNDCAELAKQIVRVPTAV